MKIPTHPIASPDPLYLFACRVRCMRLGDTRSYEELVRASNHPNEEIRTVAEVFLEDIREASVLQPAGASSAQSPLKGL